MTEIVTVHVGDAALPMPRAAPLFVARTVMLYDSAVFHWNGVRTRRKPSQRPIEMGRPGGGDTSAHVMAVPTFGFVAVRAAPMNVPVEDRSFIARSVPQLIMVGAWITCVTAQRKRKGWRGYAFL